jgi:type VI secretion system protein ImpA
MSIPWSAQQLLQPLTAEQPCGQDLEDTPLLASFDAYRLFGQSTPLDAAPEPGETRVAKPIDSPEWAEIRDQALEALGKSKDLRLLVHLGTALLRTDGVPAFAETLKIASQWLASYWTQAYPLVDGDGMLRRNVLNCFADQWAVLDALRRLPLVTSRKHGRVSLRDIDIATGQAQAASGEARVDEAKINAAFEELSLAELQNLQRSAAEAVAALKSIVATMGDGAGPEAVPSFDALSGQLTRIDRVLRGQLTARQGGNGQAQLADSGAVQTPGSSVGVAVGAIASRQDAVRALDAVAEFFRRNEPSSPIPLLVERAKRLVSKDFLEVLADVAPDALGQARAAGGIRQTE